MGGEKKLSPFALGAVQSQALLSPDFDIKSAVVSCEGFMIYLVLDDPWVTVAVADEESVPIVCDGHTCWFAIVRFVRSRLKPGQKTSDSIFG